MPAPPKPRFAGQFAPGPENGTARPPSGGLGGRAVSGVPGRAEGLPAPGHDGGYGQVPARTGANLRGRLLAELVAPGAGGVAAGAGLVAEVHAAQRPRAGGPARGAGG